MKVCSTIIILAMTTLFCCHTLFAASSDKKNIFTMPLEELLKLEVVTARKRKESKQDIPGTVRRVNRKLVEDTGELRDLRDFTDLVSGLTIHDAILALSTEPSMRGAGAAYNRMSVSAVGLYRNGAYFATPGLGGRNIARMDYYDLERAEVAFGPQGALYGRNAMGGSINLISRKPEDKLYAQTTARWGELDFWGAEILANVPLNDKLFIRVSQVNEYRDDGFYSDVNGNPVDDLSYEHTRISIRSTPNDDLDITYTFDIQDETPSPTIRTRDELLPFLDGDRLNTFINTMHETTHNIKNHNLIMDLDVNGGVLTSVSNLRDRKTRKISDGDFFLSTDPVGAQQREKFLQIADVNDIFFQEVRYSSDVSRKFVWLAGADYFTSRNDDLVDNLRGDIKPRHQLRRTTLDQQSWAAFGSAEYNFESIPLTLSGELRYAVDDFDGSLVLYRATDLSTPERDFGVKETYRNMPFAVSAAYNLKDINSMMYAKVSSSYRHGGMNDGPGHPLAKYESKLSYEEEEALAYEIGWKSSLFERKLLLNASAHYTYYNDFLDVRDNGAPGESTLLDKDGNALGFNPDGSRVEVDSQGNPGTPIPRTVFMDNVGDAEEWGLEAELSYRTEVKSTGGALFWNIGWSKQDGEVKKLRDDISNAFEQRTLGATMRNLRGDQWKSQVVYEHPLTALSDKFGCSGAHLMASATYVYESGGVWWLDVNNPVPMDRVSRMNARLGIRTERWSLILSGKNLTDTDYHTWEFRDGDFARLVDPKFFFAEFSVKF